MPLSQSERVNSYPGTIHYQYATTTGGALNVIRIHTITIDDAKRGPREVRPVPRFRYQPVISVAGILLCKIDFAGQLSVTRIVGVLY